MNVHPGSRQARWRSMHRDADSPVVGRSMQVRRTLAGSASDAFRHWILGGLWFFLVVVLPINVFTSPGPHADGALPMSLVHIGVAIFSATLMVRSVWDGSPRIMATFFWIFSYLWLGIAPSGQLLFSGSLLDGYGDASERSTATEAVLVSILSFAVGYSVTSRARLTSIDVVSKLPIPVLTWRRVQVLTMLASAGVLVVVRQYGGFSLLFVSRQEFDAFAINSEQATGSLALQAILYSILSVPPLVALVAWFYMSRSGEGRSSARHRLLLLYLICLNLVANSPFSHPRSWVAVCILSVILSSHRFMSPKTIAKSITGVILGFVVLFPLAGYFRYTDRSAASTGGLLSQRFIESGDYDAYKQMVVGVMYVRTHGFDDGFQLLGPMLFWLPRTVWSGKPGDTGVLLGQFTGASYTNLSAPLAIELFLALGLPLVAAGFVALGWLWARIDRRFVADFSKKHGMSLIIVPTLSVYQLAVLRGSLLTVSGLLTLIVAVPLLVGRKARPRHG